MKDLMSLNNLGVWASTVKGISNLRYLGGLHVMISFKNKVDADSILSDCSKWEHWFTKLKTWEGNYIPYERIAIIAWLKVHGVPPQLWDPVVINLMGEKVGKLIQKSEASMEDSDLSLDCSFSDHRHWVPDFVKMSSPEISSGEQADRSGNRNDGKLKSGSWELGKDPGNEAVEGEKSKEVHGVANPCNGTFSLGIVKNMNKYSKNFIRND
ncbi:hypothetical protein E3N88_02194 [Mikania micrantha]|uniref:Uncharacterized protein n=1 Tax=Mikania micrantha TaxID=192012 RepID=A0A5N6Q5D4_9ASTR|nr:hypothetical protein E3N88_02194 [Mikania micrantha]